MAVKIIFEDFVLISGMMCDNGCGYLVEDAILTYFETQYPACKVLIESAPFFPGINKIFIRVEQDDLTLLEDINIDSDFTIHANHLHAVKNSILKSNKIFSIIDENFQEDNTKHIENLVNILINIVVIISIIVLYIIFPPSLGLSIGLIAISFLASAFTSREYILSFFKNLSFKNVLEMPATMTLAWFLALGHCVYHVVIMPIIAKFADVFMCFMMPLVLVTIVNVMDEIRRIILSQSERVALNGLNSFYPEMQEQYECFILKEEDAAGIRGKGGFSLESIESKVLLRAAINRDMAVKVKHGESFPVDGIIISGDTFVDASVLTGELNSHRSVYDTVTSGMINIGPDVIILADANNYNSTSNRLFLKSNFVINKEKSAENNQFYYMYFALIFVGFVASIIIAVAFGIFTTSLMLQCMVGILFAICPCTIAITHLLPKIMLMYGLNKQGILVKDEELISKLDKIKVVVFDKTGTLTTGVCEIVDKGGLDATALKKIALLERRYGFSHPIAKALQKLDENYDDAINDVNVASNGLSGVINGERITIGDVKYLQNQGCSFEEDEVEPGLTPIYVAINNEFKGRILIKHEVRPGIIDGLKKLTANGIKIIMLTGDKASSAIGFNEQNGRCFLENDIHSGKSPEQKREFLLSLGVGEKEDMTLEHVCFIGDGINDAYCSRALSKHNGISLAITSNEKVAFFSDACLNGSVDMLVDYQNKEQNLILQNRIILFGGAVVFLACISIFPVLGISFVSLVPTLIMLLTTCLIVANSTRGMGFDICEENRSAATPILL